MGSEEPRPIEFLERSQEMKSFQFRNWVDENIHNVLLRIAVAGADQKAKDELRNLCDDFIEQVGDAEMTLSQEQWEKIKTLFFGIFYSDNSYFRESLGWKNPPLTFKEGENPKSLAVKGLSTLVKEWLININK